MMADIQKVLRHFEKEVGNTGQWYGWSKVDVNGNPIPNNERMQFTHLVIHDESATAPTQADIDRISAQISNNDLAEKVIFERERRLAAGFDYDFGDSRGVHRIGTSRDDQAGWSEVTAGANALVALGNGSQTIDILTDTGQVTITSLEWQEILVAAAQFRQPIWLASFTLIAMTPIPDDYQDDGYWP